MLSEPVNHATKLAIGESWGSATPGAVFAEPQRLQEPSNGINLYSENNQVGSGGMADRRVASTRVSSGAAPPPGPPPGPGPGPGPGSGSSGVFQNLIGDTWKEEDAIILSSGPRPTRRHRIQNS